jgi:hypothetical protein
MNDTSGWAGLPLLQMDLHDKCMGRQGHGRLLQESDINYRSANL